MLRQFNIDAAFEYAERRSDAVDAVIWAGFDGDLSDLLRWLNEVGGDLSAAEVLELAREDGII